jgi:lipooligosaccharide transport system ATP-binding protein
VLGAVGGRIVAEGSPRALIAEHSTREVVELRFATPEERDAALPCLVAVAQRIEALTDRVLVYAADGEMVEKTVEDAGHRPESLYVRRSTLEDVFLILTGRSLED